LSPKPGDVRGKQGRREVKGVEDEELSSERRDVEDEQARNKRRAREKEQLREQEAIRAEKLEARRAAKAKKSEDLRRAEERRQRNAQAKRDREAQEKTIVSPENAGERITAVQAWRRIYELEHGRTRRVGLVNRYKMALRVARFRDEIPERVLRQLEQEYEQQQQQQEEEKPPEPPQVEVIPTVDETPDEGTHPEVVEKKQTRGAFRWLLSWLWWGS
jgi:colicin import membrane protein